jgi:lipopolysaccharide/colanic/teichoic acid biosynthesis glycosyltransferase
VKRALDLGLLLLASPVLFPVTAAVAFTSLCFQGRPLFFLQPRLGKGRAPFRIWKLRTMTTEAEVAQRRPTPFGGWLRQRGLDELPQLFNVLLGEMSLVGPRPLTDGDATRLERGCPRFEERFAVAPGLTGLAQVYQARGAELTARIDAHYAAHRSAWLDVRVLLRTAWINLVGKRRGAKALPVELR